MTTTSKPPISYWVIAVLALIWNAMGCMVYVAQKMMTQEDLDMLPEAERAMYMDVPAWATAAFAIAVWFGLLACIFLLIRRKLAKLLFIISLLGVLAQVTYNLFISNAREVLGTEAVVMPVIILIIAVFLLGYANKATQKGWLK